MAARVVLAETVGKPDLLDSYPKLLSSSCQFTESGVVLERKELEKGFLYLYRGRSLGAPT